jgi:dihydroxy-acid dehydratase
LNKGRVDILISAEEIEKRRKTMKEVIPPNQTPWQEIFRSITDQLSEGMVLKPAVKYRDVAHKFVPRDSH